MPLVAPNLDDRTFEDLLREARLRIPRYCPDWTDFNDSDPGMAVVQLFAWFTEMMFFRLNQVPERNYIKFLQLLNLDRRPARPARAHVCFTATPGQRVTVPARSRLEAPGTKGEEVVFETVAALDLIPYPLDTIHVQEGIESSDYSKANEQGSDFRPLGWNPQVGNALYLGFAPGPDETAAPAFPKRLTLRVFLPQRPSDRPVRSQGPTPGKPAQALVWEYQSSLDLGPGESGDRLDRWRPLTVLRDETHALTREGNIELRGPGEDILATPGGRPTVDEKPRYWLRCRLAEGVYAPEAVPVVAMIRANVVEVENLMTINEEVLGESDGFQREYTLRHLPVDPASLATLEVEGPGTLRETWERRDDFLASKPDDRHFTLNPTSGVVRFGNGRQGRIPPPDGLVIARRYLAGGGSGGNVSAGALASVAGVRGVAEVTNPRPAGGGTDEETTESLIERAPLALRGDSRAVTADDYRRFAEKVDGVAKANAIPLRHPDYPDFDIPGTLTVVIIPDDTRPLAQPSQDLLDRTARALEEVKAVGTELFVTGPRYRPLEVRVEVTPEAGVSENETREGVRLAIEDYFAPVRRPEEPNPTQPRPSKKPNHPYPLGWPFVNDFYPSRLYEVILSATDETGRVRLVRAVTRLDIQVDGQALTDLLAFSAEEMPACTAVVETRATSREVR